MSGGALCRAAHADTAVVRRQTAALVRRTCESVRVEGTMGLIAGRVTSEEDDLYDADVTPGCRASSPRCLCRDATELIVPTSAALGWRSACTASTRTGSKRAPAAAERSSASHCGRWGSESSESSARLAPTRW